MTAIMVTVSSMVYIADKRDHRKNSLLKMEEKNAENKRIKIKTKTLEKQKKNHQEKRLSTK